MKYYIVLLSIDGQSAKYYVHAINSADAISKTLTELRDNLGDEISISCKLTVPVRE